MTLSQLEHFLAVAKSLSITKAAEKLYISHSAISRSISNLEKELGVSLLIRRPNRTLALSDAGRTLETQAKDLIDQFTKMKENIQRLGGLTSRVLRVNSPNFDDPRIFEAIAQYINDNPHVNLQVTDTIITEMKNTLMQGKADVVIEYSFAMENIPENYEKRDLFEEDFCILVSKRHPLAKEEAIDIRNTDLDPPVIIDSREFEYVSELGKNSLFRKKSSVDFKSGISLDSAIIRVKTGMDWILLPRSAARHYRNTCSIVNITGLKTNQHTVSMYWDRNNKNPELSKFLDCLESHFS